MTLPWSKLPRYLAGDPRLTLLSPEGSCAYLAARLLADDYGSLWCVGDRDAAGTLAAVIAAKRSGDAGWARRAVEECVSAGLLDLCDEGAALRVVDWQADGAVAVPTAGHPAGPAASPAAAPAQPARGRGRPPKGSAPMTPRERRVRSAFRNREWAEFRGVAEDVTWEQWAAEHPATRTKLLRVANENRERNSDDRTKTANENPDGANENPPSGRAVSETSEPSETQRDGETRGKSESPDAGERERKSRTKLPEGANETPGARTKIPAASCSDREHASPFAADVVLSEMSRASGQRIAALGSSTHMDAFSDVARDLMARGVTAADLVRAGGHAAHVPWIQRQRKPLTVERLSAAGGKTLVELLTGAAACDLCGGASLPDEPASPEADPDEPALAAARARYLAADLNRPATQGAPAS